MFSNWDKSKIEMTHGQFRKKALGCNSYISNIMGEVGTRPLLVDVIKRVISYIQNIMAGKITLPTLPIKLKHKVTLNQIFKLK